MIHQERQHSVVSYTAPTRPYISPKHILATSTYVAWRQHYNHQPSPTSNIAVNSLSVYYMASNSLPQLYYIHVVLRINRLSQISMSTSFTLQCLFLYHYYFFITENLQTTSVKNMIVKTNSTGQQGVLVLLTCLQNIQTYTARLLLRGIHTV